MKPDLKKCYDAISNGLGNGRDADFGRRALDELIHHNEATNQVVIHFLKKAKQRMDQSDIDLCESVITPSKKS